MTTPPGYFTMRKTQADDERLKRLQAAWRAYYSHQSGPVAKLAESVTASSAMRDLLFAWDMGLEMPRREQDQ